MDGRDRRKYPRFEGEFKVDLLNMGDDPNISQWEAVVEGTALDISKHGLRLASNYNVKEGSMTSIVVYYRGRESVCLCKVMWKRPVNNEYLYGLYVKEWSKLDALLGAQLDAMEAQEQATSQQSPSVALP